MSRFCANSPLAFYRLPEKTRLRIVRTHLGPSGGWFARDMVMGKVPLLLGYNPETAEVRNGKVHLQLRSEDGLMREVIADHVVAATGYKVEVERLKFVAPELRAKIKTIGGSPVLSTGFESSIPGLHFVGVAAANSFGPLMRFAYGAEFTAQRITQCMMKSVARVKDTVAAERAVVATK